MTSKIFRVELDDDIGDTDTIFAAISMVKGVKVVFGYHSTDEPNLVKVKDQERFDDLIGIFAYDTGAVDSGIHDEVLRGELISWIGKELSKPENEHRIFPKIFDALVRDYFLSDKALAQGYGLEDVREFINWLDDEMR